MKRLWLFLALSSAALLAGALISLFFRDWVREQVVIPMAYLFWVLRLFVLSIPESFYWGILILIGLFIASWSYRPVSSEPGSRMQFRSAAPLSRYETWLRYVRMINSSRFAGDNLARDLIRQTVLILAYQHGLANDEVYSHLEHEDLGLPSELYAFVRRRGFQTTHARETRLEELIHRLIRRRVTPRPPGVYSPIEREANQIISQIEYLLSQTELKNSPANPEEAAL